MIRQNSSIILFLFHKLVFINALNFHNKIETYAIYEGWKGFVTGNGSLEFSFKTYETDGILLELTSGLDALLRLDLYKGMLRTCHRGCSNGNDKPLYMSLLGSQWNDMEWHNVRIRRKGREIRINIEGFCSIIMVEKGDSNDVSIPTKLYFGGRKGELKYG